MKILHGCREIAFCADAYSSLYHETNVHADIVRVDRLMCYYG